MSDYASDQELITAVCAGSEQAADTFIIRYRPLATGLAIGRFGFSETDAEDLFNQLIVMLWQNDFRVLRAWRKRGRFSTYLSVIVLHLCQRIRKVASRTRPINEQQLANQSADNPGPEETAQSDQATRQIQQIMHKLSPRDRLLIQLRYHDECTPHQIGQIMGISGGSARKAVFDALRRMRKRWDEYG